MTEIRQWLIDAREGLGLTQTQVAAQAGVTTAHVFMIERGQRCPSPEVAQRIGSVLGIDWTLFFPHPTT